MNVIYFLLAYAIILAPLFFLIVFFVWMELNICRQGGDVYPWTSQLDRLIKYIKHSRDRQ